MCKSVFNAQLYRISAALLALLILFSTKIYADRYEDNHHLQLIARSFVINQIEHNDDERIVVQITTLDSNTKLSRCDSKIDVSFAQGNSPSHANAIALQCHAESGWRIYVPFSVQRLLKVVSAKHPLSPGDILTIDDLTLEEYDINRFHEGYFQNINDVVGLSIVRSMSTGAAITKKAIRQVAIIKRNQTVTIILKKEAIEIAMTGIAQSDGYLNESIKILNPSSKKIIDAQVTGPDRAQLIA